MKQFFVESAGAVLAVRQSREDDEPLLLLHGGPGVPDYLQAATAPMLSGSGASASTSAESASPRAAMGGMSWLPTWTILKPS